MIRILLVDDHAMLREGLRMKFESYADVAVIGECSSAADLMSTLTTTKPDVLVLDVKLPDGNGISLMKHVREQHANCKFVILTMYDHVRYAIHALESGAHGFVVKGEPFEELVTAVREVHQGRDYVSTGMSPKLVGRIKQGDTKTPLDALSQREFEVLTMLGSGLSTKEIAARLNLSEKSVTTYRARTMEKLHLQTNADLVRFSLESGLID